MKLYKDFVRQIQHPTEAKHIPPQYISVLMFYGGKCKPVPLPIAEFMEQVNYCKEQGYL
jgi:hypothetical protein